MNKFRWLRCIPYSEERTCSGVVYADTVEEAKVKASIASETVGIGDDNWTAKDYGATVEHEKSGWAGFFCFISLTLYEVKTK